VGLRGLVVGPNGDCKPRRLMQRKQQYLSPFWRMRGAKDQRGRSLAERGAKTTWGRH